MQVTAAGNQSFIQRSPAAKLFTTTNFTPEVKEAVLSPSEALHSKLAVIFSEDEESSDEEKCTVTEAWPA
jgi:hypothetical protein